MIRWKRPNNSEARYCPALVRFVVRRHGMRHPQNLMDVGCGDGNYVRAFSRAGLFAAGVDWAPAEGMLHGDIEDRKWWDAQPDCSYDWAFCKSVLEHVRDPAMLIQRIFWLLRQGGRLITITPDWRFCYRGFYCSLGHVRPLTQPAIEEAMEACGFEIEESFLLRPSIQIVEHWRLRWPLAVLTDLLPARWAGSWRYGKRCGTMAYVVGRKPRDRERACHE